MFLFQDHYSVSRQSSESLVINKEVIMAFILQHPHFRTEQQHVFFQVGYTIAGAFIFHTIEGNSKVDIATKVLRTRAEAAGFIWNLTHTLNIFQVFSLFIFMSV